MEICGSCLCDFSLPRENGIWYCFKKIAITRDKRIGDNMLPLNRLLIKNTNNCVTNCIKNNPVPLNQRRAFFVEAFAAILAKNGAEAG
jgi:hypothetical protein